MTTLITGASSGIGEALAVECARRGESLYICGRNEERLAAVAEKCAALATANAFVKAKRLDVTDEAAVKEWFSECEAFSPVERVFSNAGVSTGEETEENVRTTFAVNVNGNLNVVLAAIETFRARRSGGQILITASIAGYGPLPSCPSYSATKSCMKTWALSLRGMLAREGIKVSAICPGFVRSRITDMNTCPMPFFMEADRAARIILSRADRNIGLIAFPWPMRLATWAFASIPYSLAEIFGRFLPKKVSRRDRQRGG